MFVDDDDDDDNNHHQQQKWFQEKDEEKKIGTKTEQTLPSKKERESEKELTRIDDNQYTTTVERNPKSKKKITKCKTEKKKKWDVW